MRSFYFAALLATAACGGSAHPTTSPTGATATATLAIAELKFYSGSELGAELKPNGDLLVAGVHGQGDAAPSVTWQTIGRIDASGAVRDGKGVVRAQLGADGTLTAPGAAAPLFTIGADSAEISGHHVTIDGQGVFHAEGAPADAKPFRVEGATDAQTRRTALFVVALILGTPEGGAHQGASVQPAVAEPPPKVGY